MLRYASHRAQKTYKKKDNTSYLLSVSFKNTFLLEYKRLASKRPEKLASHKISLKSRFLLVCFFWRDTKRRLIKKKTTKKIKR